MLVKGFAQGSSMFDVTPVENMFITEYMMRAPGDYVKVYLFLLNICYYPHDDYDVKDVAKELGMEEDEVKKALIYWAQLSLIEIESRRPFIVSVKNIKYMLQNEKPIKNNIHDKQELIMQIQQSFGGRRLLNTFETQKVLGWAETYKWSSGMIALVVAWCVDKKGTRVSLSYIDKVIATMVEKEIDSYEEAENYLIISSAWESGATKLLKSWNENRVATKDEIVMYKKWTEKYEMTEAVINQARKQMVGVSGNKFKYLDSVLTDWSNKGIRTYEDMQEHLSMAERLREITKILYNTSKYDEKTENEYKAMRKLGFSHKVLTRVAIALKQEGVEKIEDMHKVVAKWAGTGVADDTMMMDKLDAMAQIALAANAMVAAFGETRNAAPNEKRAYMRWIEAGYSHDDIINAAAQAMNADKKQPYMNAILKGGQKNSGKISSINQGDIAHGSSSFEDIFESMEEMS
ncbi:MAG: DnaD domain protein [Eubacteriales bacterium]